MARFLVKTEPSTYAFADLRRDRRTVWDGVSNPVALRHLGTIRKGDTVALKEKSRELIVIRHNVDTLDRQVPPWLEAGAGGFEVSIRDVPLREHIDVPVREQLIVELYSK